MRLIKLAVLLLTLAVAMRTAAGQAVYTPVAGTQQITPMTAGIYLLIDNQAPVKLVPVIAGQLFAEADEAKGQAAVDACSATGTPSPASTPAAGITSSSCETVRQPAINADIATRVKAFLATIPNSVLVANKLRVAN